MAESYEHLMKPPIDVDGMKANTIPNPAVGDEDAVLAENMRMMHQSKAEKRYNTKK